MADFPPRMKVLMVGRADATGQSHSGLIVIPVVSRK